MGRSQKIIWKTAIRTRWHSPGTSKLTELRREDAVYVEGKCCPRRRIPRKAAGGWPWTYSCNKLAWSVCSGYVWRFSEREKIQQHTSISPVWFIRLYVSPINTPAFENSLSHTHTILKTHNHSPSQMMWAPLWKFIDQHKIWSFMKSAW